jgi:hypothetical protein
MGELVGWIDDVTRGRSSRCGCSGSTSAFCTTIDRRGVDRADAPAKLTTQQAQRELVCGSLHLGEATDRAVCLPGERIAPAWKKLRYLENTG